MRMSVSTLALYGLPYFMIGWLANPVLAQVSRNNGSDFGRQFLQALGNNLQQQYQQNQQMNQPGQFNGGGFNGVRTERQVHIGPGGRKVYSYKQVPSLGGSNLNGINNSKIPRGGGFGDAFGPGVQYQPGYQLNGSNLNGIRPMGMVGGGFSNAFGAGPQYQYHYQPQVQASTSAPVSSGPVAGERYYVPSQYAGSAAGSVITYGQYRYKVSSDGTMVLYTGSTSTSSSKPKSGPPTPGERYKIPVNYLDAPPGKRINYFGYAYLTNNDGTMTALDASESFGDFFQEDNTPQGPVPGKRYRVPDEHAGAAPGSVVTYGGYRYVVNDNGTMTSLVE